jgi:hypothetical protein
MHAMTAAEQCQQALHMAQRKRLALAAVKRALRNGALTLDAAMADPPAELANYPLIDVIRWTRTRGYGTPAITAIGRQALRDSVNLMVPLGDASTRSRAWVAQWGHYWGRPGR